MHIGLELIGAVAGIVTIIDFFLRRPKFGVFVVRAVAFIVSCLIVGYLAMPLLAKLPVGDPNTTVGNMTNGFFDALRLGQILLFGGLASAIVLQPFPAVAYFSKQK